MHARWQGTTNLDCDNNFKKFTDDVIPNSVINSKKYIKDLVDPDILQKKQKNFNLSTDPKNESKPELKKILFEVSHGLKNFTIEYRRPARQKKQSVSLCSVGNDLFSNGLGNFGVVRRLHEVVAASL